MLREFSNLAWPKTPYAADMRPVARKVRLLTGMSIQWADDGSEATPIGAAAVFIPVHRTASREIVADTLHFGYRSVAVEPDGDRSDIPAFVDGVLVQARREAEIIGWHSFPDDLHALRPLLTTPRAGIDSVGEAWADRPRRERSTALLVDTADDGMQLDSALTANRLDFGPVLWRYRAPVVLQQAYEDLTVSTGQPGRQVWPTQHIGAAALMTALATALMAGRQAERLTWNGTFDVAKALRLAAWDTMPLVFDSTDRQV
ncbi:hypothetical protein ACIOJE_07720 [Kitasatospora sp. NPDC087861]|uniref:hypothetical protein n=1 Tax=Kitasatospora sp. NPDC087861 TaxID=3364070 RepID=UPI0037F4DF32